MSSESVRKAYSSVPYVSTAADLVDEIAALKMQVEGLERENESLRLRLKEYEYPAPIKNFIE